MCEIERTLRRGSANTPYPKLDTESHVQAIQQILDTLRPLSPPLDQGSNVGEHTTHPTPANPPGTFATQAVSESGMSLSPPQVILCGMLIICDPSFSTTTL